MVSRKHYDVVAAVVEHGGRVLCLRKGTTRYAYTSHRWEFPGGKVEAGEMPEQALQRELREELCIHVEVLGHLVTVEHDYPDFSITLRAYRCSSTSGEVRLLEHEAMQWLCPSQLPTLDWCAADVPIAQAVAREAEKLTHKTMNEDETTCDI